MTDIETIAKARKAVERLAHTEMNLSLEEWSEISGDILAALPVSDGVTDEMAETGRMIGLELKRVTSITVGYRRGKGYFVADAGCEPHAYGDTLVDALRASLGPLPAPPTIE